MQLRLQPSDPVLFDDEIQAGNWEALIDAALGGNPWPQWNTSMAESGVLAWPCPSFPTAWFATKGAPAATPACHPQCMACVPFWQRCSTARRLPAPPWLHRADRWLSLPPACRPAACKPAAAREVGAWGRPGCAGQRMLSGHCPTATQNCPLCAAPRRHRRYRRRRHQSPCYLRHLRRCWGSGCRRRAHPAHPHRKAASACSPRPRHPTPRPRPPVRQPADADAAAAAPQSLRAPADMARLAPPACRRCAASGPGGRHSGGRASDRALAARNRAGGCAHICAHHAFPGGSAHNCPHRSHAVDSAHALVPHGQPHAQLSVAHPRHPKLPRSALHPFHPLHAQRARRRRRRRRQPRWGGARQRYRRRHWHHTDWQSADFCCCP